MIGLFVMFWTVLIFTSIAWYGFLIFYVGFKGGKEIRQMARRLQKDSGNPCPDNNSAGKQL